MEKQEVKSRWDELARQIGAEISPETEQLVEPDSRPAAEAETQKTFQSEAAPHVAAPRRAAAGWDNLASEFGLPTPEPEVELVVERVAATAERVVVAPAQVEDVEKPRRDRTRPERRERSDNRRESRGPRNEDSDRQREERPRQREDRSRRRERPPRRGQDRAPRVEEEQPHESADVAEPTVTDTPQPPVASPQVEPSKPAAISLWHKIFGLPADQTSQQEEAEQIAEPAAAAFDVSDERRPQFNDDFDSVTVDPRSIESDEEKRTGTGGDDESIAAADDESKAADRDRPRRRRRGRGGRGRRSESGGEEARSTDRPRRGSPRADNRDSKVHRDRARDAVEDEDLDEDDELESGLQDDDSDLDGDEVESTGSNDEPATRGKSALQRSIPSWDEAIGCIIDANMQGRSQRRPSSHPGSRSNTSHGRTRGRRRR